MPARTPFALTGSGTDADGDALVYLWEQTNYGYGTQLASNDKTYGPLFRVFGDDAVVSSGASLSSPSPGQNLADGNATRVFPDMVQVLAGNTNAATGRCPYVSLPEDRERARPSPRLLLGVPADLGLPRERRERRQHDDFRLTGRDLDPNGGGVAHDEVSLTVDPSAGPFLVTSQSAAGATVDERVVRYRSRGPSTARRQPREGT